MDLEEVKETTRNLDLLCDQVIQLTARMDQILESHGKGNHQTIIHKTEGMSAWGAAAVTACMMTFLGLILFAMVVIPEQHDLRAWEQIHQNRITALEAKNKDQSK